VVVPNDGERTGISELTNADCESVVGRLRSVGVVTSVLFRELLLATVVPMPLRRLVVDTGVVSVEFRSEFANAVARGEALSSNASRELASSALASCEFVDAELVVVELVFRVDVLRLVLRMLAA
jgi:hypothetical protein